MERKQALVLGATGGIGGAIARRLLAGGWQVRALTRDTNTTRLPAGTEAITGDALDASAVAKAAEGASLIVHAVNPPGYRDWNKLVLPMLDNTIAAASQSRIRVMLPGTVYNYGPDAFPVIDEDAPQNPKTRKGAIRVEMERRLRPAAETGAIRTLILRTGDFFGPQAGNNWLAQALIAPGSRPGVIRNPSRRKGVGHQWAYLPDVAETAFRLLEREDLPDFAGFHMEGHWDSDGTTVVKAIQRVLGAPTVPIKPLQWWALRLASPFNVTLRELWEMRYLWEEPIRLSNAKLVATLGEEPRTPLDDALRATLAAMTCI
ncbi:MAG: NAD(P)H-binding protein [Methylobacterium mesophilicum]|nr:NAD(P)H-binding protein [Methylobacterium mesophilicum]